MQIFVAATPIGRTYLAIELSSNNTTEKHLYFKKLFKEVTRMAQNIKFLCMNSCLTTVGSHTGKQIYHFLCD